MSNSNDQPIKILETIRQGQIGGGESHVLDLVYGLDKSKFDITVLSFTDGPMIDQLNTWGIKTNVIKTETPFDIRVWRLVYEFLKKENFKLIHAHGTRANSNITWAARKLGIPIIYTVHGWSFHPDQSFLLRKSRELGEKYLTSKSNVTITICKSNQDDGLKRIGLERSIIINCGINLIKFDPEKPYDNIRKELNISKETTVVGFIVRITKQKDPLTMIEAIHEVSKTTKNIKFLMVGDGDLKEGSQELAKKLGITDNVIFLNFRQDVPALLNSIDIYCLPSLWEGLPLGLLEAMAMKKSIIATPVNGTVEVIENEKSGLLIPIKSPKKLADAIIKLHDQKEIRDRLGNNARETINEKFTVKRMISKIEAVYEKVLAGYTY